MRYQFELVETVIIDSELLEVGNGDEALALAEQGFGDYFPDSIRLRLVHVGN
jgi:hypothetical protein